MDLTLVGTFLVALLAGFFSWKQLQNDDDINVNEEQESALYEPRKKPSKTKNNKNQKRGSTTRRSSVSTTVSTATTVKTVETASAKVEAVVEAVVAETASKPVESAKSAKNSGFNMKSACEQIKTILAEAESSEKLEKLLEQAKLCESGTFKETAKEASNLRKQLEREQDQASKAKEELVAIKKNLEIAVRDNNEFKAKNKRVADQAREAVSKELEAKDKSIEQLKSDFNKVKAELNGFTSNEEAMKKKLDQANIMNSVLQSSVAAGVKAQRLANAAADNAISGNVVNAPEFIALKAEKETLEKENQKLAKDLKTAENSKKQMKESSEKSKKTLEKSEIARKQAEAALNEAQTTPESNGDQEQLFELVAKTEDNLQAARQEVADLKNTVSEAEQSKSGLTEQIDALKVQLSTAEHESKVAKEAAGESGDANAELASVQNVLVSVRAELEQANDVHDKSSKEIWQKLDAANVENDKIGASLEAQVKKTSEVQSNLNELTGTYDTVSNELNDYKITLSEVQVKLESFETVENQLKAENVSLKSQLETKSATPTVDTSALDAKINELSSQKAVFEAKSVKAEQKLEKTLSMLDKIETHVNEEAQNMLKIQSDKEEVQNKLAASESECNNLKETVTSIKTKLVGLQTAFDGQVNVLNQKINNLETENTSLKAVKVSVAPVTNGNHLTNGNDAGDTTSPASEKWVMLNGGENRQSVQSMSDSDADDKGTPV
jgi:chromosome segregation ATPase